MAWEVRPPLSEHGQGFGRMEVFQVENVDGHWVLVFNWLDQEFSATRTADCGSGGFWVAVSGLSR
jgi:beta-fructofuranosidase